MAPTLPARARWAWPGLGAASLAALLAAPASAAEGAAPRAPNVKVFTQALLYAGALSLQESPYNPDKQLAQLPRRRADAQLRLDLAGAAGPCHANAKLRARYGHGVDADVREEDVVLNQGGIRCRLAGGALAVSAGREILAWGSSFFLAPSNPFFIDTGKTDPIGELPGQDMLQAHWFASQSLTVTALRRLGKSAHDPDAANGAPLSAVRLDWVGEAASGGAIISRRADGPSRLGLYGTLPWSRALLLYGEANIGAGSAGWFAADGRLARTKLASGALQYTLLGGAGYTFESGWTLNAEWVKGNEGYSRGERAAVEGAVSAAARSFPQPEAVAVLASAASPNLPYLGTNYLFLQMLRSEWHDQGEVALRWTRSFGAGQGSMLSGSFVWYLDNHTQLFLLASRNVGSNAHSDFGRFIRASVRAGARFTF